MQKILLSLFLICFFKGSSQNFRSEIASIKKKRFECFTESEHQSACDLTFFQDTETLLNKVYDYLHQNNTIDKKKLKQNHKYWIHTKKQEFSNIDQKQITENNQLKKNSASLQKANFNLKRIDWLLKEYIDYTETIADDILRFLPENYEIINTTWGMLNDDKYNDCVLIIKERFVDNPDQKVILLQGNIEGKLKHLYSSHTCLFSLKELQEFSLESVTINQQNFTITSSNPITNNTVVIATTFQYNPSKNNWFIKEIKQFTKNNPTNFTLFKRKKISFENYNIQD